MPRPKPLMALSSQARKPPNGGEGGSGMGLITGLGACNCVLRAVVGKGDLSAQEAGQGQGQGPADHRFAEEQRQ